MRRCRAFIAQGGGDPSRALVFSDFAVSGSSTHRPGFESMMEAVGAGRADAIVTEDLSRISRDFADSAHLQAAPVRRGRNRHEQGAKLSYTVKSLVADLYLDDLRDKTLRGLEGRALAGFAPGGLPYGHHTQPVTDEHGRSTGSRIEIHDGEAEIVRRIFRGTRDGKSLATIAMSLAGHALVEYGQPVPSGCMTSLAMHSATAARHAHGIGNLSIIALGRPSNYRTHTHDHFSMISNQRTSVSLCVSVRSSAHAVAANCCRSSKRFEVGVSHVVGFIRGTLEKSNHSPGIGEEVMRGLAISSCGQACVTRSAAAHPPHGDRRAARAAAHVPIFTEPLYRIRILVLIRFDEGRCRKIGR